MSIPIQKFRELVFQLLYSYDIGNPTEEDMIDLMSTQLEVSDQTVREALLYIQEIRKTFPFLDDMIAKTSKAYEFDRIPLVEKNILRLGIYELFYSKQEIPPKVVIAEAIRLSKKFSTPESLTFINAIMDQLYKKKLHG